MTYIFAYAHSSCHLSRTANMAVIPFIVSRGIKKMCARDLSYSLLSCVHVYGHTYSHICVSGDGEGEAMGRYSAAAA